MCGLWKSISASPHLFYIVSSNYNTYTLYIMARYQHKRKRKEDIGISPFEIKSRDAGKASLPVISAINFSIDGATETKISSIKELKAFTDSNDFSWISIAGLNDESFMNQLSEIYDIPSNIISDVLDTSLRPQVEDYDDGVFASLKVLRLNDADKILIRENVSLIANDKIVFSFVETSDEIFNPIKNRIQKRRSKIHTAGTDYIFFSLLDVIIDNYIYTLDLYGERVEEIEEELTLNTDRSTLRTINLLKQELNQYRRDIKPAKEMIFGLRKLDADFISDENETHFKELQDNISQASEMLDYFREVLYDAIDVYHSAMSTRLNDIMAVLTIFSVVFIPLSFIASLYGMNFVNMPELRSPYGYYTVLAVMLVIAVVMLLYFRRKRWF